MIPLPLQRKRLHLMSRARANPQPAREERIGRLVWTSGFTTNFWQQVLSRANLQPKVFEWYVAMWASKIKLIQEYQQAGIPIKCVHHDRLIEDPEKYIGQVFSYLDIPSKLVETAVKTMEHDSQAGLVFSRVKRVEVNDWQRDEDQVKRCNRVLEIFGSTDLDSEFILQGTF